MTEAKKTPDQNEAPNEAPDEELAETAAEDEVAAKAAGAEEAAMEDPVAALEAEVSSLKDQLLRAFAETENVRRRAQREREDAGKYAAVPLIRDLLGIADNLQRALEALPEEGSQEDEQVNNMITGVRMIERELLSVFERHKIEKLEPMGEPFDPHSHEALFELPDPSKPSGTVVQIMEPGYRLHDRLLRPARVGVAKGGESKGANGEAKAGGAEPGAQVDTKV